MSSEKYPSPRKAKSRHCEEEPQAPTKRSMVRHDGSPRPLMRPRDDGVCCAPPNELELAVNVNNLSKTYQVYDRPADRLKQSLFRWKQYYRPFDALKNVSLAVKKGEAVGIVGRNGSGKSTLLQLICGTLTPTAGEITVNGRVSALLELGAGFNPEFTGEENLRLNAAILGLSPAEIEAKRDGILTFANIGEHIRQPVKTYSSGMAVRLAFAVAVATDPDILIVDEALAVGDAAFQRKCFSRIREMVERGAALLFVSHAAGTVLELCSRALLLDGGELLLDGAPKPVIAQYERLLFAPEERAASVRKEIGFGIQDSGFGEESADPSLTPESTVAYERRGAVIENPSITTLDGAPVNILSRGGRYRYRYDVYFTEDAEKVRFGMLMKTTSGVTLGGATTHTEKEGGIRVKEGRRMEISFAFTCALLPGTYFTNAGCSAVVKGERVHLHRLLDAAMFRVREEGETHATGIVDFQIESRIGNRESGKKKSKS